MGRGLPPDSSRWSHWRLVAEAGWELVRARRRLRSLTFSRLQEQIRPRVRDLAFGRRRAQSIVQARAAVFSAMRRLPWRTTCFERALACLVLLQRRGVQPTAHYGVRKVPARAAEEEGRKESLEGHVWLTDRGAGVIGLRGAAPYREVSVLNPAPEVRGEAVLVLGAARSGTSTVAAALGALGVELGPRLRGPVPFNPRGLFEDTEAAALNAELLRRAESGGFSPRLPDPRLWRSERFDDLRRIAGALVVSRFGHAEWWGMKDPRTAHCLDFWLEVLEGAGFRVRLVLALRRPSDVAESLHRSFGVSRTRGLLLWLAVADKALRAGARNPLAVVHYDALVAEPMTEMERLSDALGLEWTSVREEHCREFSEGFVDRSLRHCRQVRMSGRDRIAGLAAEAWFRRLLAWAEGRNPGVGGVADVALRRTGSMLQSVLRRRSQLLKVAGRLRESALSGPDCWC